MRYGAGPLPKYSQSNNFANPDSRIQIPDSSRLTPDGVTLRLWSTPEGPRASSCTNGSPKLVSLSTCLNSSTSCFFLLAEATAPHSLVPEREASSDQNGYLFFLEQRDVVLCHREGRRIPQPVNQGWLVWLAGTTLTSSDALLISH